MMLQRIDAEEKDRGVSLLIQGNKRVLWGRGCHILMVIS
jgi:hypothetical protein